MRYPHLVRVLSALVAVLFTRPLALAGEQTITSGHWTGDKNYCVGTLHITRDTAAAAHAGEMSIRSVDSVLSCDSYCGDGIVNGVEECDSAGGTAGCTSNCKFIQFPEYGGMSPYLDDFAEMQACRNTPPPVPNSQDGRDVTFLAFGDTQYGNNDKDALPAIVAPGILNNKADMNRRHIEALNRSDELTWPSGFVGAGQPIENVRGVIIAGDIAQEGDACTVEDTTGKSCGWFINGAERDSWFVRNPQNYKYTEWAQFRDEYGLCGNKRLRHPTFEGAGNHDYFRDVGEEFEHPIHKYIAYRNNFRQGLDRVDPLGKGHYSWTWDDVHFVQLNLAAKDATVVSKAYAKGDSMTPLSIRTMKPYSALTFLKHDLALHASSGQPVVLISHYPWVSLESRFSAQDRRALFQVIKAYNVVALIHGHTHASKFRQWAPCDDVPAGTNCLHALGVSQAPNPYPVIDAGNPFYRNGNNKVYTFSDFRRYGHYTAVRIIGNYLQASTVSWRRDGVVCDFSDAGSCDAASGCAWSVSHNTCSSTTEICLPGVTTLACDPNVGPCNLNAGHGGWAVKVRLSDRAVVQQTQRHLHQYCPGY